MRLPINPWAFLGRLLGFFAAAYLLWIPLAPAYTHVLLRASQVGVWLTEISTDPLWSHAHDADLARHGHLLRPPRSSPTSTRRCSAQGIPAEWVMANLVLLVPLMLATPAPTWRARFGRLGMALRVALFLQVLDIIVAIKVFYASTFPGYWSHTRDKVYQFLDAFFQSWDTQLFPFAIWAGIHFRQLLRAPAPPAPRSDGGGYRGKPDRPERAAGKAAPRAARRRKRGR